MAGSAAHVDMIKLMSAERDPFIAVDAAIQGGTPVIRGTRITVYSVLGRIEHGDTIEDILADNPDITREAVEAAVAYAQAHSPAQRFVG